jgi:hypothetical protein
MTEDSAPLLPATPITAALAAMEGALARWSTEFTAHHALSDPDAATLAQAAQEARVAAEIRRIFRSLSAAERSDPAALAHARAVAAAVISRELAIHPPLTLLESHEERALRGPV